MINFKKLQLTVDDQYSFVGIKRDYFSRYSFYLPKGFEEVTNPYYWRRNNLNEFEGKCNLFFLFYRIFENFKSICNERGYLNDTSQVKANRDTTVFKDDGLKVERKERQDNIFYSKIDPVGKILNAYDEPKILSLVYRLGKSESLDYGQVYRYLDRGIFLPNHTIYLDSMNLPRQQIRFESTDIVAMYCYLLCEIQVKLDREINSEIAALAERFHQCYIGIEYGLFQEDRYETVLDSLKNALEIIDRKTALKDSDYWELYDAIELFLYGSLEKEKNGKIWGFDNFHSIWESMCLTYIVKQTPSEKLLFLDSRFVSQLTESAFKQSCKNFDFSNIFQVNGTSLFPDAVVSSYQYKKKCTSNDTFNTSLEKKTNWNDYSYWTSFYSDSGTVKIASNKTEVDRHTFEELKELYPTNDSTVSINQRLPRSFFAFWEVNTESISPTLIDRMRCLNHIYYLALEQKIKSSEDFSRYLSRFPYVLKTSLLRDQKEVVERFSNFFYQIGFVYTDNLFSVIDAKYLPLDYFNDCRNFENIKDRSIRKQFVYEYLIKKELERIGDFSEKTRILSEFWLPKYRSPSMFDCKFYHGNILRLISIDFEELAKYYY